MTHSVDPGVGLPEVGSALASDWVGLNTLGIGSILMPKQAR